MEAWKARGYVPDSDEEEDSQDSAPSIREQVLNDLCPTGESQTATSKHGTEFLDGPLIPRPLGDEDEISEAKIVGHESGLEIQTTVTTNHDVHDIPKPFTSSASHIAKAPSSSLGDEDVDELQQDHYSTSRPPRQTFDGLFGLPDLWHTIDATPVPSELPRSSRSPTRHPQSSPLSSLSPSSTRSSRRLDAVSRSTPQSPTQERTSQRSQDSVSTLPSLADIAAAAPPTVKGSSGDRTHRSLRQRNPIQLHPYALESEKYRQVLKARGLRPLKIDQEQARRASVDSQDDEDAEFSTEESQAIDVRPTAQDHNSLSPQLQPSNSSPSMSWCIRPDALDGDDFPDLNVLLRPSEQHVPTNGYKRRKVAHASSAREEGRVQHTTGIGHRNTTTPLYEDEDTMFDVPPSPPRSSSSAPPSPPRSITAQDTFRYPKGFSPRPLPTPITSSEPRRPPRAITSGQASADKDAITISLENTSDSDPEGSTPSRAMPSNDLHRVQRKIRGVLPASWLKLDLKTQNKQEQTRDKAHRDASPARDDTRRGVARPITVSSSRSPSAAAGYGAPLVLSSSEDSGPEIQLPSWEATLHSRRASPVDFNSAQTWLGEAAEDDSIDAMLPAIERHRARIKSKRSKKKQQTTLAGLIEKRPRYMNKQPHRKPHEASARRSSLKKRRAKIRRAVPVFLPPRLGILDAPPELVGADNDPPQFLKIARRTARSRNDKGRHGPSRKYLRLATVDDTRLAEETLQAWREGTIAPKSQGSTRRAKEAVSSRWPLHARAANGQSLLTIFSKGKGSYDYRGQAESVKHPQTRDLTSKPRQLQISLDRVVQHKFSPTNESDHARDLAAKKSAETSRTVRQGQISSSLQHHNQFWPALLESSQRQNEQDHRNAAFRRDLSNIHEDGGRTNSNEVLLGKVVDQEAKNAPKVSEIAERIQAGRARQNPQQAPCPTKQLDRRRKRSPAFVNLGARKYQQPEPPQVVDEINVQDLTAISDTENDVELQGLGPFGTYYSPTFEITALPAGLYFHETTFIGSGDFGKSLNFHKGSGLDDSRGCSCLTLGEYNFQWGPWSDTVSTQLVEFFDGISHEVSTLDDGSAASDIPAASQHIISMQKELVKYISDHLSFLDPIDRVSFLRKCKGPIEYLFEKLVGNIDSSWRFEPDSRRILISTTVQISSLLLVLVNQLRLVSEHQLVPQTLKNEILALWTSNLHLVLHLAIGQKTHVLIQTLENLGTLQVRELGIREESPVLEALVISSHISDTVPDGSKAFWEGVCKIFTSKPYEKVVNVPKYEENWKSLFAIQPMLGFSIDGILRYRERHATSSGGWTAAKLLITPVLEIYLHRPGGLGPSFNNYCRALFGRCLHLVNYWNWYQCESIVGILYDFFVRNKFANLRNEQSRGSPQFLEHLHERPVLELTNDDLCFHILLRILGSGLRHMRQLCSEKKIKNIIWRLVPGNSRFLPKENSIRQEDLDALRNHHDLLCVLYWASPPAFRPRLIVIRDLVQLETSHREACHLSIRAWSNLVKFQLSTNEPAASLVPFAEWHKDLLVQLHHQHSLARMEIEEQARSAQMQGGFIVSPELFESTISKNQCQIQAIIQDVLLSLKLALEMCRDDETAQALLTQPLTQSFDLNQGRGLQTSKTALEALDVLMTYAKRLLPTSHEDQPTESNDDSQDFGDWSGLTESVLEHPSKKKATLYLQDIFQTPLRQLLSNAFGADTSPGDLILSRIVETWVCAAKVFVHHQIKTWGEYIGPYGPDTWQSLRDTEQTRRYKIYLLAAIIGKDPQAYEDHKAFFIRSWLESLLERESLLKFQHQLTTSIFNLNTQDILLKNLPFSKDPGTGIYSVTAHMFSERRLALISSLLSNIHEAYETAFIDQHQGLASLKEEYKDLLKHIMSTMKHKYQELGQGSNVRGTYVGFFQNVVGFLQQYTSAICPVDRFFTDSAAFPLPAQDPTYVVGQLRNYVLRLHEPRTPKQLAIFIQSTSERAAIDNQQDSLDSQLYNAMSDRCESGDPNKVTLRALLVQDIFPAYIELAYSSDCSWIMVLPVLQALRKIFDQLPFAFDITSPASVASVTAIITSCFESTYTCLQNILVFPEMLHQPNVLKVLCLLYQMLSAALLTTDYIIRSTHSLGRAVELVTFFRDLAEHFYYQLTSNSGENSHPEPDSPPPNPAVSPYAEIRQFTHQELETTYEKTWRCEEGCYYILRPNGRRDVIVDLGTKEQEEGALVQELEGFLQRAVDVLALGNGRVGCDLRSGTRVLGLGLGELAF